MSQSTNQNNLCIPWWFQWLLIGFHDDFYGIDATHSGGGQEHVPLYNWSSLLDQFLNVWDMEGSWNESIPQWFINHVKKTIKNILKWMIRGYPYFRKPPYHEILFFSLPCLGPSTAQTSPCLYSSSPMKGEGDFHVRQPYFTRQNHIMFQCNWDCQWDYQW